MVGGNIAAPPRFVTHALAPLPPPAYMVASAAKPGWDTRSHLWVGGGPTRVGPSHMAVVTSDPGSGGVFSDAASEPLMINCA